MNADLEKLIRLQRAESDLRRVEAELADVPRLKGELETRLAQERARLDAAREALTQSQKTRRQLEAELLDLESRRSKYKGQLMEVKTNKEYTAMLHEIEGVERDVRASEDTILGEMERGETLAAEVQREETAFREIEQRHRAEGQALDDRARGLAKDQERLKAERGTIAATVPSETLDLFQRVARLRGVAVAEARDAMCQVCHLKLQPQMFVDIKRNEEIMQCPACHRILYYEPPAPTVSPGP